MGTAIEHRLPLKYHHILHFFGSFALWHRDTWRKTLLLRSSYMAIRFPQWALSAEKSRSIYMKVNLTWIPLSNTSLASLCTKEFTQGNWFSSITAQYNKAGYLLIRIRELGLYNVQPVWNSQERVIPFRGKAKPIGMCTMPHHSNHRLIFDEVRT